MVSYPTISSIPKATTPASILTEEAIESAQVCRVQILNNWVQSRTCLPEYGNGQSSHSLPSPMWKASARNTPGRSVPSRSLAQTAGFGLKEQRLICGRTFTMVCVILSPG